MTVQLDHDSAEVSSAVSSRTGSVSSVASEFDVDSPTISDVARAARDGDSVSLQRLIDGGAALNEMDTSTGYYPLHYAVRSGNNRCVEMLLRTTAGGRGLDINARVHDSGRTALHLAVIAGENAFELCRLLTTYGADATLVSREEPASAFHLACAFASRDVVELLLNEQTFQLQVGSFFCRQSQPPPIDDGDDVGSATDGARNPNIIGGGGEWGEPDYNFYDDVFSDDNVSAPSNAIAGSGDTVQMNFNNLGNNSLIVGDQSAQCGIENRDEYTSANNSVDSANFSNSDNGGQDSSTASAGGSALFDEEADNGFSESAGDVFSAAGEVSTADNGATDDNNDAVIAPDNNNHDNNGIYNEPLLQHIHLNDADNSIASFERIPHHFAISHDNVPALQALLDFADRNPDNARLSTDDIVGLAVCCITNGRLNILKLLFDRYSERILAADIGHGMLQLAMQLGRFAYVDFLVERGCKPFNFYRGGNISMDGLSSICRTHESQPALRFSSVWSALPDEIVDLVNRFPYRVVGRHPLHTAIDYNRVDVLEKLLDLGFQPNIPASNITWESYRMFSLVNAGVLDLVNELFAYQDHDYQCGLIGDAIVESRRAADRERTVALLVAKKAYVRPAADNELCPLVLLMLKQAMNDYPDQISDAGENRFQNVFQTLVAAGADLAYRSPHSPFSAPDVAVLALFLGNAAVLATVIAKTHLDAALLFADVNRRPINFDFILLPPHRWSVRNLVALSAATAISFKVKTPALRLECRQLEQLVESAHSAADGDNHQWDHVYEQFDAAARLKHLCREVINKTLSRNQAKRTEGDPRETALDTVATPAGDGIIQGTVVGATVLSAMVDQLPIPNPLKAYLVYDEIVREAFASGVALR